MRRRLDARDVLASLDMTVADLADADARSLVIRHEHPELKAALGGDVSEVDVGHGPINPDG